MQILEPKHAEPNDEEQRRREEMKFLNYKWESLALSTVRRVVGIKKRKIRCQEQDREEKKKKSSVIGCRGPRLPASPSFFLIRVDARFLSRTPRLWP